MKNSESIQAAACTGECSDGSLRMAVSGRLDAETLPGLFPDVRRLLEQQQVKSITVDCADIAYCDGAGIALLVYIRQAADRIGATLELAGLSDDLSGMLALYSSTKLDAAHSKKMNPREFVEEVGKTFVDTLVGIKEHIVFPGELAVGLVKTLFHPSGRRVKDFMIVAEASGAKAVPIIGMLGFLVGLILGFQGAVLMAQFGAEIYIADFVGKSVARELGPLITAIIVAGRTGSAFAAELGTMKVNEEIDALKTMGLDPVRFLVVPRVMAATLMTPLLAVLTNVAGLAGGAVVMTGIGFPLVTYVNRVLAAVTTADYLGGLSKSVVFGLLIASSGCLCGLRTGEGASAVGNSATRAVVSSIIMIVIADGVFAVLFYYLGI